LVNCVRPFQSGRRLQIQPLIGPILKGKSALSHCAIH